MREFRFRVVYQVALYLFPVTLIMADLLAGSANGQHPTRGPNFRKCLPEFKNKPLPFFLCYFSIGDVPDIALNHFGVINQI